VQSATEIFILESRKECDIIHLISADRMNRVTLAFVRELISLIEQLTEAPGAKTKCKPLIITGNDEYFSVGVDLNEIVALSSTDALEFARQGQQLMNLIDEFPAPVYAAISGYCMGGGLDLALACDFRVCAANAIFGHRGAALGLITGWGGTQRLSDLIGRARALNMFSRAERLQARDALAIGLVSEIAAGPLMRCLDLMASRSAKVD
jgi:enoyl-CoA hydratase/carnithine racemase